MDKRICVINFADNARGFLRGQARLVQYLKSNGFKGDIILYNSHLQLGCKPHSEVPYQFKAYAIHKAYKDGYDIALYCDSSLYSVKNIDPCLKYIEENGSLLEHGGFSLGQWCTDKALEIFGISRDEAFNMPMHSACITGLNFNNEKSKQFVEQLFEYAKAEETFKGDWTNANNQVSSDKRCLGHRHDQSVATFLNYKLGLGLHTDTPAFLQYLDTNETLKNATIFALKHNM